MPFGVGCSSSNGVVESARMIVHSVSTAMVWFMVGIGLVDVACLSYQYFNIREFASLVASYLPQRHQLAEGHRDADKVNSRESGTDLIPGLEHERLNYYE